MRRVSSLFPKLHLSLVAALLAAAPIPPLATVFRHLADSGRGFADFIGKSIKIKIHGHSLRETQS
jgi:hypothetical protein